MKERITRNIKKLFELDKDHYKPVNFGKFCTNSYIEYESNGDSNKTLYIEEDLNEIIPHLKNK